jgi:hypothetical protein
LPLQTQTQTNQGIWIWGGNRVVSIVPTNAKIYKRRNLQYLLNSIYAQNGQAHFSRGKKTIIREGFRAMVGGWELILAVWEEASKG